ncbi:hypothetical protein QO002_003919 [Pararhizobium capsulatum DSM 1112]|uniref:Uncharacterized protein n=1 Tax=Pararhizobium capsulatum DSM 1112 TaxID=1121113 RepID=A0ABU0BU58_9HYPH|nr:hypothetical protein [Pararhizobium capsulatum]MDQ0321781.1 hypothetical protein [Pararhizobium capsulatum DSM 1112]
MYLRALLFLVLLPLVAQAEGVPPPRMPTAEGSATKATPDVAGSMGEQEEFVLPSGNIGCIYTPKGGTDVYRPADGGPELVCDRVEPRYVRAVLSRTGPGDLLRDVGDPSCCSAGPVLDYGQRWSAGPFSCLSTRKGLACKRDDGHSFFLSRARIETN